MDRTNQTRSTRESSMVAGMFRLLKEREAWEAANSTPIEDPGHPLRTRSLAAAWRDALVIDHERTQRIEQQRLLEQTEERIPKVLRGWGVPEVVVVGLPQATSNDAWDAAGAFLKSDKRFLVLLGEVGLGKTMAAARALSWAARKGYPGAFVTAAAFCRLSFEKSSDFEHYATRRVVAMDDFGNEHLNDFTRGQLDEWFARREGDPRFRTVLTANMSRKEFVERYGQRITDRLKSAMSVVCTGKSLRGGR